MKTFNEMPIGTRFDFIDDKNPQYTSFFLACMKTGKRTYVDSLGGMHRVGTINAAVYHIGRNF